jgi:hypothetical protein
MRISGTERGRAYGTSFQFINTATTTPRLLQITIVNPSQPPATILGRFAFAPAGHCQFGDIGHATEGRLCLRADGHVDLDHAQDVDFAVACLSAPIAPRTFDIKPAIRAIFRPGRPPVAPR